MYLPQNSQEFIKQCRRRKILTDTHIAGHSRWHLTQKLDVELLAAEFTDEFEAYCQLLADLIVQEFQPKPGSITFHRLVGIGDGGSLMLALVWQRLYHYYRWQWLHIGCIQNGELNFTPEEYEYWIVIDDVFTTGSSVEEFRENRIRIVGFVSLFRWETGHDRVPEIKKVSLFSGSQTIYPANICPVCNAEK
ncbi:hypothetical protein HY065_01815 [Candidatus Berkelbacteria bacterium]|nr:hypothetical protein [Candidatus Berkelbacteria bacterium]